MTDIPPERDPRGYDLDEERQRHDEEFSRALLMGTNSAMRFGRHLLKVLPSDAHCKLCASPLHGGWGKVMSAIGKGPWPKNPKYCSWCFKDMVKRRAGAEIPCSLLFADVRGSTELAEHLTPTAFRGQMVRFFDVATDVLVDHDAIVDKFVGDEVIGLFIPLLTGELHADRAIAAGRALLARTAGWIPIGIGVNSGIAFVGAVGSGEQAEFTAMGDPVNVTARLASAAGAGELLVTDAAAESAHFETAGLERRALELKGKSGTTEVVVVSASQPPPA
ncbi:MAG TPA: adenylate/guanylate cyclase domain-containing protein [Candidatus Limnocylindria bacterium]|jgi:adenylate cyclase|nr:adenylate/guanylate cyclase domain-containing protein [Candidatus Limnocylindria bacterium]